MKSFLLCNYFDWVSRLPLSKRLLYVDRVTDVENTSANHHKMNFDQRQENFLPAESQNDKQIQFLWFPSKNAAKIVHFCKQNSEDCVTTGRLMGRRWRGGVSGAFEKPRLDNMFFSGKVRWFVTAWSFQINCVTFCTASLRLLFEKFLAPIDSLFRSRSSLNSRLELRNNISRFSSIPRLSKSLMASELSARPS